MSEVSTKVETFTIPASYTGTIVRSGIGFAPKFLVGASIGRAATGTGVAEFMVSGVASGGGLNQASLCNYTQNNVTTTVAKHVIRNQSFLLFAANNTIVGEVRVNSLDSDGYTLEVLVAFATDVVVSIWVVGGTSIASVACGATNMGTTTGSLSFNVGFQPTCGIFMQGKNATTTSTTGRTDYSHNIGIVDSAGRVAQVRAFDNDGGTNNQTMQSLTLTALLGCLDGSSDTQPILFEAWETTGYRVNRANATSGSTSFLYLVFNGPASEVVTFQVPTVTGVSNVSLATSAMTPVGGFFLAAGRRASQARTGTTPVNLCIGMVDSAGQQAALQHHLADMAVNAAVNPLGSHRSDRLLNYGTRSGTDAMTETAAFSFSSFQQGSFSISTNIADPNQTLVAGLLLGTTVASVAPIVGVMAMRGFGFGGL